MKRSGNEHTVFNSLIKLCELPSIQSRFIKLITEADKLYFKKGQYESRDNITGPLLQILLHGKKLRKKLNNGLKIDFYNKSKITRDFILSNPDKPDHVWEPQTTKLLKQLCRRSGNVIVGGAYFGDQTVIISNILLKHKGICHAFEANKVSYDLLNHNKNQNKLINLHLQNKCLWNKSGERILITDQDAYSTNMSINKNSPSIKKYYVDSVTIDDYLNMINNTSPVNLIMLDIEGAELRVLKGAVKTLYSYLPVVIFEIHKQYADWSNGIENTKICRFIKSFGYQLFAIRDFHSNVNTRDLPIELVPLNDIYLEGPSHGFNILALHDKNLLRYTKSKIVKGVSPKLLFNKNPKFHFPVKWIKNE